MVLEAGGVTVPRQQLKGPFSERFSGMFSGLMQAVIMRAYVYVNKSLSCTLEMSALCVCYFVMRKLKGWGKLLKGLIRF